MSTPAQDPIFKALGIATEPLGGAQNPWQHALPPYPWATLPLLPWPAAAWSPAAAVPSKDLLYEGDSSPQGSPLAEGGSGEKASCLATPQHGVLGATPPDAVSWFETLLAKSTPDDATPRTGTASGGPEVTPPRAPRTPSAATPATPIKLVDHLRDDREVDEADTPAKALRLCVRKAKASGSLKDQAASDGAAAGSLILRALRGGDTTPSTAASDGDEKAPRSRARGGRARGGRGARAADGASQGPAAASPKQGDAPAGESAKRRARRRGGARRTAGGAAAPA